jgi:hypothetical protein
LAFAGCGDRNEWHEKLTLVVQTPTGKVSDFAVAKVVAVFGGNLIGNEVAYSVVG